MNSPSSAEIRAWFPSLASNIAFMENAGGSQVPGVVADAVRDFMLTSYVQTGAGYPQSDASTAQVAAAHHLVETFVGAGSVGKVALGSSTTALVNLLANAYAGFLSERDEIVVAVSNHEANVGAWTRLEARGAKIRWWRVDPETFECTLESLAPLLSERTLIVAFPHVSNLIGQVADLAGIVSLVHSFGAKVVVDGVAYAAHRAIDVEKWGVDWYVYSTYKVYGPHMAALYGRHECLAEVSSANHFFFPPTNGVGKFELGGANLEGCAAIAALWSYLKFLAGTSENNRDTVVRAMNVMETCEKALTARLIGGLHDLPRVTLLSHPTADRVPTVSFTVEGISSFDFAKSVIQRKCAVRNGHMYAYRLCEALNINPADGVVRVSLLHYNTLEEVEALLGIVKNLLV